MALDKLVDSTQLTSDLTSVANAIRTAGGTSASLSFPSGFVDAIGELSGGGGGGGGGGGDLPSELNLIEYAPEESTTYYEINHSLGSAPDAIIIIPKEHTGYGQGNWSLIYGTPSGTITSIQNCPKRLIVNYIVQNSQNWDYTGSASSFGWGADSQKIYIQLTSSAKMAANADYYIILIKNEAST